MGILKVLQSLLADLSQHEKDKKASILEASRKRFYSVFSTCLSILLIVALRTFFAVKEQGLSVPK